MKSRLSCESFGASWAQTKETKQTNDDDGNADADADDNGDGDGDTDGDGDDAYCESFGVSLGANKGDKTNS